MFTDSLVRFSEFVADSIIIAFLVVFTLRLFFRFASFLASRSWRRYRTFTVHRRRWIRRTAADEKHSSTTYCTICLEDAAEGERMRRITACSHCFHADCIDPWLEKKSTCPLCRAQIPPAPPGNPLLALIVPPGVFDMFTKGTFPDAASSSTIFD
ncbi:PREDICTED: RING-H2 finger protein ATL5-like [Camelina sativa]|uniref:RING-H2 finger protein ATL5-like n=1 Tax=Camelina sativa TaxID=90675 RepID=A0ABM0YZF2_CAMSA|nr:PREDICTED: RING-H2 finger protein ATL5-like [Camelina sativa]